MGYGPYCYIDSEIKIDSHYLLLSPSILDSFCPQSAGLGGFPERSEVVI